MSGGTPGPSGVAADGAAAYTSLDAMLPPGSPTW